MQLQITTDYAIRIVSYLAQHKDQLVTARSMASELGITYQYSMKVINQLKKGSLIDSVQGCNGGYKLTDSAARATFYDLICLMEGEVRFNRCVGKNKFCKRPPKELCDIHQALQELQDDFIKELKNRRVVDPLTKEKTLKPAAVMPMDEFSQTG
ncbi:MAG: Rrf2 family transcriptional regulator [Clostridiales Family XIII bacterium]|jgi:Rrf2 family protein|nr:Rrf2 family transcriptional regulator [Clostridiales Family XIII bacterium]